MGREIVDVLMSYEPCIVSLSEAIDNLDCLDNALDNIDHNSITEELEVMSKILRARIYREMGEMLNNLINLEDEEDEDSGDTTPEG